MRYILYIHIWCDYAGRLRKWLDAGTQTQKRRRGVDPGAVWLSIGGGLRRWPSVEQLALPAIPLQHAGEIVVVAGAVAAAEDGGHAVTSTERPRAGAGGR